LRNFGTVALEWCWLAAGRGHVYVHGGQKLWDYAAGTLILDEAGGTQGGLRRGELFAAAPGPRAALGAVNRPLFLAVRRWLGD
jgi:myo-inositol-1(or 4)-monophosphatase